MNAADIFAEMLAAMTANGEIANADANLAAQLEKARGYYIRFAEKNGWEEKESRTRCRGFILTAAHAADRIANNENDAPQL